MSNENTINLLLVDDEPKFLQTVSQRLALKNFDVTTAADGREAILAAEKKLFDVAVLDLMLPGIDGAGLLKLLKERHNYLEIIMLTGHGSVDSAVECTKLGAIDYLEKPFDFEKLVEAIKNAYEERMKKKFENSARRIEEIQKLSIRESPFGILRALAKMDDGEK